jgi:polyhydroxybutyrate depolymerase
MPVNLRQFVDGYALAANPAQDNGRSIKEDEANRRLREYAARAVTKGGTPGTRNEATRRLFEGPDGVLQLYKTHQTPWLVTYFKDYMNDPEGCRSKLPRRYRYAFGDMGPEAAPPGDDEHVSDHHAFNTYLVSAASLAPGQLLVFRGKAARTPHTLNGDARMGDSSELRYWNLSMHAGSPTRLTPVVNVTDETAAVDRHGYYTIVIGSARDKPANATAAHGITWREWPAGEVLSVNWRILSTAAATWAHAPQHITWPEADLCRFGRNPAAVRARMGKYFPQGRYLSKAQVEQLAAGGTWPSAPTAVNVATGGSRDLTLDVDGTQRSFRLHRPAAAAPDEKLPLVIALHSGQSNAAEMEMLSGLSALADKEKFMVVYPNAIGRYRGKLYWNDGRAPKVDDVRFIGKLIDELVTRHRADTRRVYVTGISNGASMTNRLAVELGARLAAIAPVAGTIGVKVANQWKPPRPMPVMYFHGTADPLAYYEGGSAGTYRGSALSAEDFVQWWAKRNACRDRPRTEALPDKVDDGTQVERRSYSNCAAGADVVFYRIEGGGHTWPGGQPWLPEKLIGRTSGNIDASAQMWVFFVRHQR